MTITTYAPLRIRTTGVTFAAASEGNLSSGSGYFWISARNRGGFNLLSNGAASPSSSGVNVSWSAGQKVTVTIASGAVSAAETYGLKEFVVSFNTSDDHTTARRIASIRYRDAVTVSSVSYPGEGAVRSLPLTIDLTEDEHLVYGTGQIVANQAALPSGNDEAHGMVRYSTANAAYYRLDTEAVSGVVAATTGFWVDHVEGFSQYIADTTQNVIAGTQPGGCDRPIQDLTPSYIINPPRYTPDGSEQQYAPYFSVNNGLTADSGSNVGEGTRIAVRISQSGVDVSELFSSSTIGTLIGECTRSTGALDTGVDGAGSDVVLGDDELSSGLTGLVVPQDLVRGNCLIYQVRLQVDASRFGGRLKEGDQLQVLLFNEGRLGYPSRVLGIFGSLIFPSPSGRCRILPGATTGANRLGGGGLVVDDATGVAYSFNPSGSVNVTGLATNTADQIVAISGKLAGDVTVRASAGAVLSFEKIRAKVSTASGTYTASDSTGAIAISGSTQSLQITVSYPADADGVGTIRSDYPDVIAGNTTGDFTVPELKVFVNKDSGGWEELPSTITVTPGVSQQFLITDISGAASATLPDSSSTPEFGLWDYSGISGSAVTNASSLAAGSYEVRVAYYWPSPNSDLTNITHDTANGITISEATISFSDLVAANGNTGFTTTTADFTQPAFGASVSVSVASSDWISAGQTLFVVGGGYYTAAAPSSTTTVSLTNLGYAANADVGATISSSAKVSPSGLRGENGYGLNYKYDSGTSSPPASGELRFNNATLASITEIYLHETDGDGLDAADVMDALNTGSKVVVWNRDDGQAIARFAVNGALTDNGSDRTIPVTYESSSGSFVDGDDVFVSISLRGDTGAAATISVGTVTTLAAGESATVTNSGTSGAAELDFGLPQGAAGSPYGLRFTFSAGTSSPPASGELRFNNGTVSSATEIYVHGTDRDGTDISAVLAGAIAGSLIAVQSETNASDIAYFTLDSQTDNGSDRTLTVTHAAGSPSFSGSVSLLIAPKGATGATGVTGATGAPGLPYTFDAGTTSGAASGEIRFNNATLSSATEVYINATDRNSADQSSFWDEVIAGTILTVQATDTQTDYVFFKIDSISGSTERTLGITYLSDNGTFVDAENVQISAFLKGATGSVSSTTSLNITTSASAISTGAGEVGVWAQTSDSRLHHRDPSNGPDYTVADLERANTFTGVQTSGGWAIAESSEPTTAANQAALWNDAGEINIRPESDGTSRSIAYQDIEINEQAGTTYTLVLSDRSKLVDLNNAAAITLTVPANSSVAFPIGTQILFRQKGAGQPTFSAGGGVTINSAEGKLKLRVQHSGAALIKLATDAWWLFGDLTS